MRRICFDTCSWSGFLKGERHHDLASLSAILKLYDQEKIILLIPAIIICEIATADNPSLVTTFELAIKRDNAEQLDITIPVARFAADIRRLSSKSVKTPDALVIAAAHYYGADLLVSSDTRILSLDGQFGIKCKIGEPSAVFDHQWLLNNPANPPAS